MCQNSTKILQGYLTELLSRSEKITAEQFVNSELRVRLQPLVKLHHQRKKRVSKEQRCSLLKKLLLKTNATKNSDSVSGATLQNKDSPEKHKGGLRDLVNFTQNFDFGFKVESYRNYDHSPLERLTEFSHNFFCSDFSEFRSTVLYILENEVPTDSEEEEMIASLVVSSSTDSAGDSESDNHQQIKIEEVIIEPDLQIKKEYDFESEDCESAEAYDYSSNFVEACYDEDATVDIKKEISSEPSLTTQQNNFSTQGNYICQNKLLAEIIPVVPQTPPSRPSVSKTENTVLTDKYKTLCSVLNSPLTDAPPATELLGQFVARFTNQNRRGFSTSSIRCRTRGNPYINPHLQKQFQLRSFTCNTCNRRFKSPGYLNAHIVKLKH